MRSCTWASPSSDGTKVSLAAAPRLSGLCSAIQTPSSTIAVPTARFQLSRSSTNATPKDGDDRHEVVGHRRCGRTLILDQAVVQDVGEAGASAPSATTLRMWAINELRCL